MFFGGISPRKIVCGKEQTMTELTWTLVLAMFGPMAVTLGVALVLEVLYGK